MITNADSPAVLCRGYLLFLGAFALFFCAHTHLNVPGGNIFPGESLLPDIITYK